MRKEFGPLVDIKSQNVLILPIEKAIQPLNSIIQQKNEGKFQVQKLDFESASLWLNILFDEGVPSFIRAILSSVNHAKPNEVEDIAKLAKKVFIQLDAKIVNTPEILKQLLVEANNKNSPSHWLALRALTLLGLDLAEQKDLLSKIVVDLEAKVWNTRHRAARILIAAGFSEHAEISKLILNALIKELDVKPLYIDQEQKNIKLLNHFGPILARRKDTLRLLLLQKSVSSYYKTVSAAEELLIRWMGPVANVEPAKMLLLEAGEDQNPLIRQLVIKIIGRLEHKLVWTLDLFAMIVTGLNDPDEGCQEEALKVLTPVIADIKDSLMSQTLVKALANLIEETTKPDLASKAAQLLIHFGPIIAHEYDVLRGLLATITKGLPGSCAAEKVLLHLGDHIGAKPTKEILLNAARNNDRVFIAVMAAFGTLEAKLATHTDIVDIIINIALQKPRKPEDPIDVQVFDTLDKIGLGITIPANFKAMMIFREILNSEDLFSRTIALRVFSHAGPQLSIFPDIIDSILTIAIDQDEFLQLRRLAILAIGRLGHHRLHSTFGRIGNTLIRCYNVLISLINDKDFTIKIALIEAFSELGSDLAGYLDVLRFVIEIADNNFSEEKDFKNRDSLRAAAIKALQKLGPNLFTNEVAFLAVLRARAVSEKNYLNTQLAVDMIFEAPFDFNAFSQEVLTALLQAVHRPQIDSQSDTQAAALKVFANFGLQLVDNPKADEFLKVLIKLSQVDEEEHKESNQTIIPASYDNCITARKILAKLLDSNNPPIKYDVLHGLLATITKGLPGSRAAKKMLLDLGDHIGTKPTKEILLNAARNNDRVFIAVMAAFGTLEAKLATHTDIVGVIVDIALQKPRKPEDPIDVQVFDMLGKIGLGITIPASFEAMMRFQEMLKSEDPLSRKIALHVFSHAGPQLSIFPDIIDSILAIATNQDEFPQLRRLAILAIGRLGHHRLHSTFGRIGDTSIRCYNVLISLINDRNFTIKIALIEAFSELGFDLARYLKALRFVIEIADNNFSEEKGLENRDSLRATAIKALQKLGPNLFTNEAAFLAVLRARAVSEKNYNYLETQLAVDMIFKAPFDFNTFSPKVLTALLQEVHCPQIDSQSDTQAAALKVFANFGLQLVDNPKADKFLKVLIKLSQVDEKEHKESNQTIIPASDDNCITARKILAKLLDSNNPPIKVVLKVIKLVEIGYEPQQVMRDALRKIKPEHSAYSKAQAVLKSEVSLEQKPRQSSQKSLAALRKLSVLNQKSHDKEGENSATHLVSSRFLGS